MSGKVEQNSFEQRQGIVNSIMAGVSLFITQMSQGVFKDDMAEKVERIAAAETRDLGKLAKEVQEVKIPLEDRLNKKVVETIESSEREALEKAEEKAKNGKSEEKYLDI